MINAPILSQRDPRWGENYLGASWVKIKDYGCVITALTSLANTQNVGVTNSLFRNNGVYLYGTLVIWANVKKVFPYLELEERANYYNNAKVADWVYNKKIPVIVQVDAAPIGSPRTDHYVLYVGDRQCMDPWTGRIRPTSDFPITKGAIFYKIANLPLTCEQKGTQTKDICNKQGISDTDKLNQIRKVWGV